MNTKYNECLWSILSQNENLRAPSQASNYRPKYYNNVHGPLDSLPLTTSPTLTTVRCTTYLRRQPLQPRMLCSLESPSLSRTLFRIQFGLLELAWHISSMRIKMLSLLVFSCLSVSTACFHISQPALRNLAFIITLRQRAASWNVASARSTPTYWTTHSATFAKYRGPLRLEIQAWILPNLQPRNEI